MRTWLESLREICQARDTGRLVVALKELVPDYSASVDLLKRITGLEESCGIALHRSEPVADSLRWAAKAG